MRSGNTPGANALLAIICRSFAQLSLWYTPHTVLWAGRHIVWNKLRRYSSTLRDLRGIVPAEPGVWCLVSKQLLLTILSKVGEKREVTCPLNPCCHQASFGSLSTDTTLIDKHIYEAAGWWIASQGYWAVWSKMQDNLGDNKACDAQ